MFRDVPNSWSWVAFSDLYNPQACGGPEMDAVLTARKELELPRANITAESAPPPNCWGAGMYTPRSTATVRGKADVSACSDQAQYVGTLVHGQSFHLLGSCDDKCVWCGDFVWFSWFFFYSF
jgi:hypothetical protein